MKNACKDGAEKFAALDLNWWTRIPEEVIGRNSKRCGTSTSA
jgi:hypothetical protein